MIDSISALLLREVLDVCRAKSCRGADEWHRLKQDIEKHLLSESIDASPYKETKVIVRYRDTQTSSDLMQKNIQLEKEVARMRRLLDVFYAREAELYKIIKRSPATEIKKVNPPTMGDK